MAKVQQVVTDEVIDSSQEKLAEKLWKDFTKSLAKNKLYFDVSHGEITIKNKSDEEVWYY